MNINIRPDNTLHQNSTSEPGPIPADLPTTSSAKASVTPVDPKLKKRNDNFRASIDVCKIYRRKMISKWSANVDYRRGKPFSTQSDDDQIAVNMDWPLTKAKQASLFSQVPEARINHNEDLLPKNAPWALPFQKKLNETIRLAGVESAMDECIPDCINAAGIGVAVVSYESISEDVEVPSIDISTLPPILGAEVLQHGTLNGQPVPTETIPRDVDHRYLIQRISPSDFLWPINFTASDFDRAPWLGRSGRMPWAEALVQFKLDESKKDEYIGEERPRIDKISSDIDRDKINIDDLVGFDEIFYHAFTYNPEIKNYSAIHHVVFIHGKPEPVIDEPWKGQKTGPTGKIIGAQRYPIRVLSLSYLTDEAIPPSDSAIGRPQVNEINKSRTQDIRQRERSIPVRTADVNRLDPAIMQSLMRGTWQGFIPVQGDGSRIITEISRAQMPPENGRFYQMAMGDLQRQWTLGSNQLGSGEGVETKGEAQAIQSDVSLPRTRERSKVAAFFTGIAEVLGGLICIYEDPSLFGAGFDPAISTTLKYSVLADSTVLLDAGQKLQRLDHFLNVYAKSGWVSLEPVLQEIAQLSGLDPSIVIQQPQPKPPAEPNISLRLTGVEDLLNPLTLAFLMQSGQAPSADLIEQAKALIQQAVTPPAGLNMPSSPLPLGGLPMLPGTTPPPQPGGPENQPPLPTAPPLPPLALGPPPGTPPPSPPPPVVGEGQSHMTSLPKINSHSEVGWKK